MELYIFVSINNPTFAGINLIYKIFYKYTMPFSSKIKITFMEKHFISF